MKVWQRRTVLASSAVLLDALSVWASCGNLPIIITLGVGVGIATIIANRRLMQHDPNPFTDFFKGWYYTSITTSHIDEKTNERVITKTEVDAAIIDSEDKYCLCVSKGLAGFEDMTWLHNEPVQPFLSLFTKQEQKQLWWEFQASAERRRLKKKDKVLGGVDCKEFLKSIKVKEGK